MAARIIESVDVGKPAALRLMLGLQALHNIIATCAPGS